MEDYTDIVVGAGSSGCALAARLSEDPERSVLLVEAGPDYASPEELPPEIVSSDNAAATHDWGYQAGASIGGNQISYLRGKLVGGTGAINAAIGLRPDPRDCEEWVEGGATDWTWENVEPYLNKLEDDRDFGDRPEHGKGGPLPIRRWQEDELLPVQKAFVAECRARGYDFAEDLNLPYTDEVVGILPMTAIDRQRQSTSLTYLGPARSRENLTVLPDALADRVVFEGNRATGVEVLVGGERRTLKGQNVIVSAGAIATPALLWRSGIGPAGPLRELGVEVVSDLPGVGRNLQDHPSVVIAFKPKPGVCERDNPVVQTILRFPGTEGGPSDMNLYMFSQIDTSSQYQGEGKDPLTFMIGLQIATPRSTGTVTIDSLDPAASPLIDLNACSDPFDVERMTRGLRLAWEFANSERIGGEFAEGIVSPPAEAFADDESLLAWMHETMDTGYHPVGTAKIGADTDPEAVVDQSCRVRGVEGLRVCDASLAPEIPRVNVNVTCIMFAERLADLMKAE